MNVGQEKGGSDNPCGHNNPWSRRGVDDQALAIHLGAFGALGFGSIAKWIALLSDRFLHRLEMPEPCACSVELIGPTSRGIVSLWLVRIPRMY